MDFLERERELGFVFGVLVVVRRKGRVGFEVYEAFESVVSSKHSGRRERLCESFFLFFYFYFFIILLEKVLFW